MVIALLNQKGGAGKTTLAIHLAEAFVRLGKKTLLVDADPQGSALDWAAIRPYNSKFPVIGLPKPNLHKELPNIAKNYDIVFVDGPPRVNDLTRAAIMASDMIAIPVQPSPFDIWAAKDIVDLLKEAALFKDNLKSVFIINRKIVNTAIGRNVAEALASYSIQVLKNSIGQRVAFAESVAQGLTVMDLDQLSAASSEVMSLSEELLETMI